MPQKLDDRMFYYFFSSVVVALGCQKLLNEDCYFLLSNNASLIPTWRKGSY